MNKGRIFLGVALSLAATSLSAHGSDKPRHGGVTQVSGEMVIELVRRADSVDVYVVEEDQPVAAAGLDGRITVAAAGAKQAVALTSADGNRLTAAGLALPDGAKVVVALTVKATGARAFGTFQINQSAVAH